MVHSLGIRRLSSGEKADDGLDAFDGAGLAEFERAEQIAGVGDGDGGHVSGLGERGDLVGLDRAFAEGVGGVDAEVDKVGVHTISKKVELLLHGL